MIASKTTRKNFSTTAVHAGEKHKDQFGSHINPIYQTSTFVFNNVAEGASAFQGEENGASHIYSRLGNPTVERLERAITELETLNLPEADDFHGLAFGSGMAAITTAILANARGGHIIAQDALYGCTSQFLEIEAPDLGMSTSFLDVTDLFLLEMELKQYPNTKMVYLESISNPTMRVADIRSIAELTHKHGAILMVDNTFATPFHIQPLKFGADIVAHSTTKYLGGHGSVIGGALVIKKELTEQSHLHKFRKNLGGIAGPMDAWLLTNGIKTLPLRMSKHSENAMKVASYLEQHPKVEYVWYPGLASHPDNTLANQIMEQGFGGIISFELKGGFEAGKNVMNSVELCTLAVSLGTVDTLIQHPASMTHSVMDPNLREKAGINEGLVRISVGIEDVEDIIFDLEQAFEII